MKKLLLIILISFSAICLRAQPNLDSLWGVWNDKTQPDTTRLKALDKIASDGYLARQPDSAFYFAQMEYDFAEKRGLKKQMAVALNTQGSTFYYRSDYPKAMDYHQRSLKIMKEIGNKNGIAYSLGNIGLIYKEQGYSSKALEYYQRTLKIMEQIGEKRGIAKSLNNIGIIYKDQGDYPKALDYYQRGLKIEEEIGYKTGIAASLLYIGNVYATEGEYPKALDYFQRSLIIGEDIGYNNGIAYSLNNIGILYMDQGDYPKALEYRDRSLKIMQEIGNKNGIAGSLINLGNVYHKQRDYQKSINECSKGLLLAQEIGSISLQRNAYECLYDAFKAMGNGNKALEYHEQMLALDDSLNAEETGKKLQQMEFAKQMLADSLKQEGEKLRVQIANDVIVRKESRNRNIAIAAGIFFLLLAGGLYSRVNYVRRSRAKLQTEKDRSDNLLLNILPAEIAEELKEKGRADARDFEMVSILFTDFKNFTEASAKLSAANLVNEINVCFEAFDGIMEKYGIEKIKTIGDAYMAAGGLPVPTNDSVKNTVLAALEMQDFIVQRHKNQVQRGESAFEMRVGIHTGPVVAGIVGVKKFQYDIWGDTVNTASRMENAGEIGKVNISEATYELLKDDGDFVCENRGKIEVKGKGEIEMYFVSEA